MDSSPGNSTASSARGRVLVLVLLLLVLASRLGLAYLVQRQVDAVPGRICLIPGDAEGYWELAEHIAHGEPYAIHHPPRFVLRMPGFPLLLAAPIKILGVPVSPTSVQLFLVRCYLGVIGTGVCAMLYLLGRDLFNPRVGIVALILGGISPPLAGFSVLLLSESSFTLALLFSLWMLLPVAKSSPDKVEPWKCLWGGMGIALATYIRPTWILMAPLYALWDWAFADKPRLALWRGFIIHVGLLIALLPWIVRNYQVTGHLVITTLWSGPSLYDGLHPQATGESDMTFVDTDGVYRTMSEYDANRHYSRLAWQYLRDEPAHAWDLAGIKFVRFWSPWPNANQFRTPLLVYGFPLFTIPIYLLALYGLRRVIELGGRNAPLRWEFFLLLIPLISTCGVHLFYVSSLRYRFPVETPLLLLSAFGIVEMIPRWRAIPAREVPSKSNGDLEVRSPA